MSTIKIQYDKKDGSPLTERLIIPTHIPDDFISAIEVTNLLESDIDNIKEAKSKYDEYVKSYKSDMLKFDQWLKLHDIDIDIQYKRFKNDKIKFL